MFSVLLLLSMLMFRAISGFTVLNGIVAFTATFGAQLFDADVSCYERNTTHRTTHKAVSIHMEKQTATCECVSMCACLLCTCVVLCCVSVPLLPMGILPVGRCMLSVFLHSLPLVLFVLTHP